MSVLDNIHYMEQIRRMEAEAQQQQSRSMSELLGHPLMWPREPFTAEPHTNSNATTMTNEQKLDQLKKSVQKIESEPFTGKVRKNIENKIVRLHNAGATSQALILEQELQTRDSLIRIKEWDYKLLTKNTIDKFKSKEEHIMRTSWQVALKIHIDPLEKYVGNPQNGEAKDRIIPDVVLDKLEEAKERELFDEYCVLWAEKVKDPILLGMVNGCEDYFFICEWGDDITFEQLTKGKEK